MGVTWRKGQGCRSDVACCPEVPTSVRADGSPFLLRGTGLGRHRLPERRAFLRREKVTAGLSEEGQPQGVPSPAPREALRGPAVERPVIQLSCFPK